MASSDGEGQATANPRHPSYELQRSYEKDTHCTGDTGSLSDNQDADYGLSQDLADRLVKRTEMRVAQVVASSSYVQRYCGLYQLPRFDREDFELGELIAFGGFSNVYAVQKFNVDFPGSSFFYQATFYRIHKSRILPNSYQPKRNNGLFKGNHP